MNCPHCKKCVMNLGESPQGTKAQVICINCGTITDIIFNEDKQPVVGCVYPPYKPRPMSEENFRILSQQHT